MLPPLLTRRYLCASLLGHLEEGELSYVSCHLFIFLNASALQSEILLDGIRL